MNAINSISSSATTSGTTGATQPQVEQKRTVVSNEPKEVKQAVQKQEAPVDNENLKKLIDRANIQMTAAGHQHLSFGYEERLNRLYVQIKDNATGEVVREIPPRKLIEQQAAMSEMIGMILDRNA
jgi:flagellar protein FlaG